MINLIFPITVDKPDNRKFFEETKKRKDINFLVGVSEDLKEVYKPTATNKNVQVCVYKNGSNTEEIINALKDYTKKGKIIVIRAPIAQRELDKFISSNADITYCTKKKEGKVKTFFKDLGQKIVRTIFGFSPYQSNGRAIAFGEGPSDILREGYNISYATRVDRWKGYSYAEVDVQGEEIKPIYNVKSVALSLAIWSIVLLMAIAGTVVYFCFMPATFLSVFVAICGLFLSVTALLIAIAISLLKINAGERYYEKAIEIITEKEKIKKVATKKVATNKATAKKTAKGKTKTTKKKESK